jgi:hypothetical protein
MAQHGTPSRYNAGCSCDTCLKGHRERMTAIRARLHATPLPPDDPRHGKPSTYSNWGCRCTRCTAANTQKSIERRLARQ